MQTFTFGETISTEAQAWYQTNSVSVFQIQEPQPIYSDELETINNKQFSRREIDVIACLISGRTAKKIASLLAISPKTVESHIYNIKQKLQCSSRNHIIDFMEKTGKYTHAKKHYSNLLLRLIFEEHLKKISEILKNKNLHIYIFVGNTHVKSKQSFLQQFRIDLNTSGVTLSIEEKKEFENFLKNIKSPQKSNSDPLFVFSLKDDISDGIEINEYTIVPLTCDIQHNYYYIFFEVLKVVAAASDTVHQEFLEFKRQYQNLILEDHQFLNSNSPLKHESISNDNIQNFPYSKRSNKVFILYLIATAIISFLSFFAFNSNALNALILTNSTALFSKYQHLIISDLPIPHQSTLLQRSAMINTINKKFSKGEPIQTVVLVGMGGAGKTTLARYYSRQQKSKIIWEINAESKESLGASFKELAYALATTETTRKILNELEEIKSYEEREKQIIIFVKNQLKTYPNWFLIFDNVEIFNNIVDYFPLNSESWGSGKVIVTTRDANIKNNSHINPENIIETTGLSEKEKLNLFTTILYGKDNKLSNSNQLEDAKEFLSKICPFPLDISTAAYYIKDTKISYKDYLKHLEDLHVDFEKSQEMLLKENGDYAKTRYGILKLTLRKLIAEHQDYKDLLLLISLIDSQNIPKELLSAFKSNSIADQFLHALKKHSLITDEDKTNTFSIHRSTQEIILSYLQEMLNLESNKLLLLPISDLLENYAISIIEDNEISKMHGLIIHYEKFLSHQNLLTDSMKGAFECKTGVLHFCVFENLAKAKNLELGLKLLNTDYEKNCIRIAWALYYLGKFYDYSDDYSQAINSLEKSISIYKNFPKYNTELAHSLGFLGVVYRDLCDYEKVNKYLNQAMDIFKQTQSKNQHSIAWANLQIGFIQRDLGNYELAKQYVTQSVELLQKYPSKNQNRLGWALTRLGIVYKESGDYIKAKQLTEQSLAIYKSIFSENNVNIAWALSELGNIHGFLGDYENAKKYFDASIKIHEKGNLRSILVASTLEDLGSVLRDLGYYEQAKQLLLKSVSIATEHCKNPLWISGKIARLGIIHRELGDLKRAKELLLQSLSLMNNAKAQNPIWDAENFGYLGIVYRDLKEYDKAKDALEKNLFVYEKHFGKEHIATAKILREIGHLYLAQDQLETAEDYLKKSLAIFQNANHVDVFRDFEILGKIYLKKSTQAKNSNSQNQFRKQGLHYLKSALKISKKHLPKDSAHVTRIESLINSH